MNKEITYTSTHIVNITYSNYLRIMTAWTEKKKTNTYNLRVNFIYYQFLISAVQSNYASFKNQ